MVVTLIVWHLINRTFYVVQSETYDLHVLFVPHRPLGGVRRSKDIREYAFVVE